MGLVRNLPASRKSPSLCFPKPFCSHEAHLPAEQTQTQPHAWISRPDGEPRRPSYPQAATCEGPSASDDLNIPDRVCQTSSHLHRLDARLKLTRAVDFESVFRHGRRSTDELFTVLYHPSSLDRARLGMTTSAKRIRTAVRRNRIRRLIRESFRQAVGRLPGIDIVVVVREPAAKAANQDLFRSLEKHWERLERATSRP